MSDKQESILSIKDLHVHYAGEEGLVRAANGIQLDVNEGETLGLVGETGAGKTTIALSILGLIPNPPGKIVNGEIRFRGTDLLKSTVKEMRKVRGGRISMIFQDPMTALNPLLPIGDQISEVVRLHENLDSGEAEARAKKMLEMVGIRQERYPEYPHQFSGGMRQRVLIAIALASKPELLIADEPTTALDVTIQAQILELMYELKRELKMSMIMITHDLGIVAQSCQRVAVIYAGEIVETGTPRQIFKFPKHPYTIGLLNSLPKIDDAYTKSLDERRLTPIAGLMPDPTNLPKGCKFSLRCPYKIDACGNPIESVAVEDGHNVRCLLAGKGGF